MLPESAHAFECLDFRALESEFEDGLVSSDREVL